MSYSVESATSGCYEGTTVLINKFGLRDGQTLAEVEAVVVPAKAAMWETQPLCETFDLEHYKAIHRWLFEDLYEWAGQIRTVDLSKKGTLFCPAKEIDYVSQAVFARLKAEKFLVGLPKPEFIMQLTDFYQRTNELHPFREGNGRTQRVFLSQLCRHAGYHLDFSKLDTDLLMIATIQASQSMDALLKQVLEQGIEQEIE